MISLKIRKLGDPVLRTEAKEIIEVNGKIRDLLYRMAKNVSSRWSRISCSSGGN
nr:hypothetical protein [Orenia marismortui]